MLHNLARWSSIGLLLLTSVIGVSAQEADTLVGETFTLDGQVIDANGDPIAGAVVEIWQADAAGLYSDTELDPTFQYFGVTTTDEAGTYTFTTIKPAAIETEPSRIYVTVKVDDEAVLTSQLYFAEDVTGDDAPADGVILERIEAEGEDALPTHTANALITINLRI